MYTPKYFSREELVPPAFTDYNFLFIDQNLLITLDNLRKYTGRIIINDWLWNGTRKYRGWRPFDSKIGALYSQHKFGRAADCSFDIPLDEVVWLILTKPDLQLISYIIVYNGFLHIDLRNQPRQIIDRR